MDDARNALHPGGGVPARLAAPEGVLVQELGARALRYHQEFEVEGRATRAAGCMARVRWSARRARCPPEETLAGPRQTALKLFRART